MAFDTRFNNQTNARDSRGLSDFDRRQRFVTSATYQLPFFAHASGFTGGALGGWNSAAWLPCNRVCHSRRSIRSEERLRSQQSKPRDPDFRPRIQLRQRPTSGGVESRLGHWANPAAYVPDAVIPLANGAPGDATGYGNAPRNCIIGPPQKNVDFTIGKTFKLTEGQNLRFRADFFNLFNHPSFANPSATDVESPSSFTQITSVVGTPRLIQFSLKYGF